MARPRWGVVPDMDTPIRVERQQQDHWLLTLYGTVNGSAGIVALTTPAAGGGAAWTELSIVHNADTLPATPAGAACSAASEDDVVRLPDGRLLVVYRNDGPVTQRPPRRISASVSP